MKLRHAAALALVGWYLMVPPVLPNGRPNLKAPLQEWDQVDAFDTANSCHNALTKRLALAYKQLGIVEKQIESLPDSGSRPLSEVAPDVFKADMKASIFAIEANDSRCIASDDPRLRGN